MCNICCDSCLPGLGCIEIPHDKHPATFKDWIKPSCQASLNTICISLVIAIKVLQSCPSIKVLMTDTRLPFLLGKR